MREALALFLMVIMVAVSASAETIRVTSGRDRDFCEILSRHTPRADVTYNPGAADVPADVSPGGFEIPDEVVFPLTVNLAEYFGASVPPGVILEPDLGTFRIRNDGSVFWNDSDLTGQALAYCGLPPRPEVKPPAPAAAPEDAQAAPKPLVTKESLEEGGEALYGAYPE